MIGFIREYLRPVSALMIVAIAGMTIAERIDASRGGNVFELLALVPERVWHGEIWRLVTWVFVEHGAMTLVVTLIGLFRFGTELEDEWGSGRFARWLFGLLVGAGAVTSLVALLIPAAYWCPYVGGYAIEGALVIVWAMQFPERKISGAFLDVGGPMLAYGTVAMLVLSTVIYGAAEFLPDLVAGVLGLAYATVALRQRD